MRLNMLLNIFLLVYAALFPIVNPVGSTPIFLSVTQGRSDRELHRLAGRVALNSFCLLAGAMIVGSYVLEFFGISLPVLRIAGGLVVTAFGWRLLHQGAEVEERGDDKDGAAKPTGDDAFYPLTMPLTVGPGSIAVAITLGSRRPSFTTGHLLEPVLMIGAALAGLAAIAVTIYICFRYAKRIVMALGPHGSNVMVRLSAFILLCIGIEILWSGIRGLAGVTV